MNAFEKTNIIFKECVSEYFDKLMSPILVNLIIKTNLIYFQIFISMSNKNKYDKDTLKQRPVAEYF